LVFNRHFDLLLSLKSKFLCVCMCILVKLHLCFDAIAIGFTLFTSNNVSVGTVLLNPIAIGFTLFTSNNVSTSHFC
jgi:hypothetical protein